MVAVGTTLHVTISQMTDLALLAVGALLLFLLSQLTELVTVVVGAKHHF